MVFRPEGCSVSQYPSRHQRHRGCQGLGFDRKPCAGSWDPSPAPRISSQRGVLQAPFGHLEAKAGLTVLILSPLSLGWLDLKGHLNMARLTDPLLRNTGAHRPWQTMGGPQGRSPCANHWRASEVQGADSHRSFPKREMKVGVWVPATFTSSRADTH